MAPEPPPTTTTPRRFASSAAGTTRPSRTVLLPEPEKACVRMSPGRSRLSSSEMSPGALPMWHITLAQGPANSAARTARRSGSSPLPPTTSALIRTFTPRQMSRFSATVFAAASTAA